ncbi:MAG: hypothetical protein P8X42_17395, partial [Calditrichaceae bacterium]
QEGFDVVIGSRQTTREGSSLLRKAGSFVFLLHMKRRWDSSFHFGGLYLLRASCYQSHSSH